MHKSSSVGNFLIDYYEDYQFTLGLCCSVIGDVDILTWLAICYFPIDAELSFLSPAIESNSFCLQFPNLAKYFPEKQQVKYEVAFPYLSSLSSTICSEFSYPFSLSSPSTCSRNLILFSLPPSHLPCSILLLFLLSLCHFKLSLLPVLSCLENLFVCDLVLPFNLFDCFTGVSLRKYPFLKI